MGRNAGAWRSKRWAALCAIVAAAFALGGCEGVLDPQGPVGSAERLVLIDSLLIMLTIVIPVILATVGFAWWFRASNTRAFYLPEWEFNGTLELVVWSIPLLVIIVLGGVAWFGSHELDPYKPLPVAKNEKPLEVQVVSMDWKWLFIYPDEGVASVNQLYLPTGRPVHFSITSASVWNAFFIPQLGGMIYSMAGMTTQMHLQADNPGVYRGISAMFSGEGFPEMHFDTHAVAAADFSKWVAETKTKGDPLDSTHYGQLVGASNPAEPATYKSVDKALFAAIVDQSAPQPNGAPQVTNPP